jgi:hypothetical protein
VGDISSKETSMNQLETFEDKLFARRDRGMVFGGDDDTPSTSSKPHTPKSHRRFNEESSDDDDDDFWM